MQIDLAAIAAWVGRSFEPVVVLALGTTALILYAGHLGLWLYRREHQAVVALLEKELTATQERELEFKQMALQGTQIARDLSRHVGGA